MLLLEAYLLDFDGDLYGQRARVRFLHRLRGQERFDSVDDLIAQMARDVERGSSPSRPGADVALAGPLRALW